MRWPERAEVADVLVRQANAVARRLGHTLHTWSTIGKPLTAMVTRCATCQDYVIVRGRSLGAPMTGGAVTFRCSGKRQVPAPGMPLG